MDGAMWGLLRACSCLCPWSKGLGLVTGENRPGDGGGEEQRAEKEATWKEGCAERKAAWRPLDPTLTSRQGAKRCKHQAKRGHWPADDTLFYLLVGGQ